MTYIEKIVSGAIKSTFDAHSNLLDRNHIGSLTKRIVGELSADPIGWCLTHSAAAPLSLQHRCDALELEDIYSYPDMPVSSIRCNLVLATRPRRIDQS